VFVNSTDEEVRSFFLSMGHYGDQFKEYPTIRYRDEYSLKRGRGNGWR